MDWGKSLSPAHRTASLGADLFAPEVADLKKEGGGLVCLVIVSMWLMITLIISAVILDKLIEDNCDDRRKDF